jgi:hypothetical protein
MKSTRTRTVEITRSNTFYGIKGFDFLDTHFEGGLFTTQRTESEGHYYGLLGKGSADIGGEFFSIKGDHFHNCPLLRIQNGSTPGSVFWQGRIYPYLDWSQYGIETVFPIEPSSRTDLDAFGTTAIARTIPTNPVVSLATFFGELRDGLPKMLGSQLFKDGLRKVRKGGSKEYLNWEFAWKPMINDLKKWIYAYSNSEKIWEQYKRDSGRRVRRRYTFPKLETVTSTVSSAFPAGAGLAQPSLWQDANYSFPLYAEERIIRRRWFSGAFTYFYEPDPVSEKKFGTDLKRLQKLYGVELTPDVLWNLAPWSWFVDWFSNTGDVITNISRFAQDELVMCYGYQMENSIRQMTYRMMDVTPIGYHIPDLTQIFTTNVKYRIQATPYGFGFDMANLTPRQIAILAALGFSRGK